MKVVAELHDNLKQAATDITTHIAEVARRKESKAEANRNQAISMAMHKEKQDASLRSAEHINMKAPVDVAYKTTPVFKIVLSSDDLASKGFAKIKEVSDVGNFAGPEDFEEPWILTACAAYKDWASHPVPQKVMAAWAGSHRKMKSFDINSGGKAQAPFQLKSGKEETDIFMNAIINKSPGILLAGSHAPAGWDATIWMFGFCPGYSAVQVSHNCAGQLRALSFGSVHTVLFDVSCLDEERRPKNMNDTKQLLTALDADTLKELMQKGLKAYYVHQPRDTVLYIPCGFFLAEFVADQELLTYGVRKSIYTRTAKNVNLVKSAIQLLRQQGLAVGAMDAMVESWPTI